MVFGKFVKGLGHADSVCKSEYRMRQLSDGGWGPWWGGGRGKALMAG